MNQQKINFIFYSIWSTVALFSILFFFRFWTLRFNLFKHFIMLVVATVFFFSSPLLLLCLFSFVCALRFSESWKQSINLFFVPSCQTVTLCPRASKRNAVFLWPTSQVGILCWIALKRCQSVPNVWKNEREKLVLHSIVFDKLKLLRCMCECHKHIQYTRHTIFPILTSIQEGYKHNTGSCVSLRKQFYSIQ